MTGTSKIEPGVPVLLNDNGGNSDRDSRYQQALDLIGSGEYGKALEILDLLAGPASREASIRYARAVAYLSTAEYRKAGTDLLFAIVLDRTFLPAYSHLGFVQLTMGREEAARKTLQAALAIDPGFADAWCVLGDVHLDLGENEKALEAFETALSLEPGNPEPHCKLAMYYLSRGDMTGLRREYELLKELDPSVADQIAELLESEQGV
jgi:tetratricopeptide (TPR) repeat protein